MWNIHDLTAFERRRPKYVRSWISKVNSLHQHLQIKNKRREGKNVGFKSESIKEERESPSPSPSPTRKQDQEEDKFEEDDYTSSDDDLTGVTIKGASQYLAYQPKEKKTTNDNKNKNINEEKYFKSILRLSPKLDKSKNLTYHTLGLFNEFKAKYKNNASAFLND